jgi:hypothetical protein
MPFFVTTGKVWPILLGLLLFFGVEAGLNLAGAHRLADVVAFVCIFASGILIILAWLKDAFWDN